jgi:hypothetical protein
MRQLLTILTTTVILWSCENQREKIEKFVFDNKQISSKKTHKYDFFPDGKIKTDHVIRYYIMAGVPFDSIASTEQYTYNSKGQVESVFDVSDSTKQLKLYNELDSLIADLTINKSGDTTMLTIVDFNNGHETRTTRRMLNPKFPENPEDLKTMDLRNYDTIYFITESVYINNRLEKTISKDKNGKVDTETEFVYNGNKKAKTLTYSFLGDTKYLSETTNYQDNDAKNPDFVTIGVQNDTLAYFKTIFQDDIKIEIHYNGQFNSHALWYYDKKNQLIGMVDMNYSDKQKHVYSYKYDDKGNILEELNYKERLSNAR